MFGRTKLIEENRALKRQIALLLQPEELRAEFSKHAGQVELKHWAVKLIAMSLKDTLGDAPNFLTIDLTCDEAQLTVTIQRKHGKSPGEAITELRQKLKDHGIQE